MHIKSIASAIALSAAIAFSGPAFAQTVVNGISIPEGDLAAVQERCDQLDKAASTRELGVDSSQPSASAGDADVTGGNPEAVNEAARATTASIDLDTLTLEACTDAGLIGQ